MTDVKLVISGTGPMAGMPIGVNITIDPSEDITTVRLTSIGIPQSDIKGLLEDIAEMLDPKHSEPQTATPMFNPQPQGAQK